VCQTRPAVDCPEPVARHGRGTYDARRSRPEGAWPFGPIFASGNGGYHPMLNAMRKSAGSWIAKILFALLILSFGAWGIGDYMTGGQEAPVAEVGGIEIGQLEFREAYGRELARLRQQFGGQFDNEIAAQLGLPQQVLEQLVSQNVLVLAAKDLGVTIGTDTLRYAVAANPAFQAEDGRFDRTRFDNIMMRSGMSEPQYLELLRGELTRDQLTDSVAAGATAPEAMVRPIYVRQGETRTAELMLLPYSRITDLPEPSEAEIVAFYDEHEEMFRAPEYRKLTAIVMRPEDVAAGISISTEEIEDAYAARSADFRQEGRRTVTQLLFADEAAARRAYDEITGGASFDGVAETAVAAGAERSDLGDVRQSELFPRNVAEAAFAPDEPGVAPPVQSLLGWHLLRIGDIVPTTVRTLDEVRDRLRDDLAQDKAVDVLHALSNRLDDELAGGATLEEAGRALDLPVLSIDSVDRSGLDPSGKAVAALPPDPSFISTAFDLPEGQDSLFEEMRQGGFYVIRVDAVRPSAVRPLDAVLPEVKMAWRSGKLEGAAQAQAEAIAMEVRDGTSIATVAEKHELQVELPEPFGRDTNRPGRLPRDLVRNLFEAAEGDVVTGVSREGPVIARLTGIARPDPAAAPEQLDRLQRQLQDSIGNELTQQLYRALRDRYGVTIDQAAMQRQI